MKKIIAADIISFLLILLFTYTGLSKILNVAVFHQQLQSMPLLKTGAGMLAWMLPLTEFFIVLLLFFDYTRRTGFICALILLAIIDIYLIYILLTSTHLPCPCSGIISQLNWPEHLILNGCIILLIMGSLKYSKNIVHKPLSSLQLKTGKG